MCRLILILLCFMSQLQALVVGTNAEFPPFCYIEEGKIVGFDIDVAKEIALRLGKEIQFKDMPFDALIPEITLGHVDFVAAGMSYTAERAKRVSFTKPYLSEDPLVILTSDNNIKSVEDLNGKSVLVVEGFTSDLLMSSKPSVEITRLGTQADCFMALKCGRANAFVTAKSTVDAYFEIQDGSQFHVAVIDGTGETCALVVPKNKPEMLQQVQSALDTMEKDGTLENLKTKWKLR